MNPTVSDTSTFMPSCENARVVASRVSNRALFTFTSAPVSAFIRLDLPALV